MAAPSPERAELVRQVYGAWNTYGTKGIEPFLSDDIEWRDAPELPDAGTFHGRDDSLRRLAEFEVDGHVLRMHMEIEDVQEQGDNLLVSMVSRSSGGSSGAPAVETRIIHLLHLTPAGLIDSGRSFMDPAEAEAVFAAAST